MDFGKNLILAMSNIRCFIKFFNLKKVIFLFLLISVFSNFGFSNSALAQAGGDDPVVCTFEILYGENGVFKQPYVIYRGIKIQKSYFGVYHGEEFQVVVEAVVDNKPVSGGLEEDSSLQKSNCIRAVIEDTESKIEVFVDTDDDLSNGFVDRKEVLLKSTTKDERIYDSDGEEIGVKSTYIIPYKFDKYDKDNVIILGNFFFIIRITASELIDPDTNKRVKHKSTERLPDLHVRKPEFASFSVENNVIDLQKGEGSLIFKYDLSNIIADDKRYLFFDIDGDGVYEINQDNGLYSGLTDPKTIKCEFHRSGGNISYSCYLFTSTGEKKKEIKGNLNIHAGSYTGEFFIALEGYALDLDGDGTKEYYLATKHKSIPFHLCDETYSCSINPPPPTETTSLEEFIKNITNTVFYIIIAGLALMIIIGGFLTLTAAGDESRIQQGKRIITYAIIGFIVALLANLIFALIKTVFS